MTTTSISTDAGVSERVKAAGAALLLGAMLIFAVGFMPAASVHNAAHDTRHTLAFPCH